jgi:hypothetical protein
LLTEEARLYGVSVECPSRRGQAAAGKAATGSCKAPSDPLL